MTLVGRHTNEPQLARGTAAVTIAVTLSASLSGTFLQTLLFNDKRAVSCWQAENSAIHSSSQHQQHLQLCQNWLLEEGCRKPALGVCIAVTKASAQNRSKRTQRAYSQQRQQLATKRVRDRLLTSTQSPYRVRLHEEINACSRESFRTGRRARRREVSA